MYVIFQQEAFLLLDAEKKRIIVENSQLKDEVSLQSIGINNLSLRHSRDQACIKIIKATFDKINHKVCVYVYGEGRT